MAGSTSGGHVTPPPASGTRTRSIFKGPNGIRAGWRFAIFCVILAALGFFVRLIVAGVFHIPQRRPTILTYPGVGLGAITTFAIILLASWFMTRIEWRTIANYGLPWRNAFGRRFWQGAAIGFGGLTLLLVVLRLLGDFRFGTASLQGSALIEDAVFWLLAFLFVGLEEEFTFRGYAQFTLTTGMGFWPAAILLSLAFGSAHLANSGEDWVGAAAVVCFGLVFCLMLRRTGSLWLPIGFHMAWDWGETFFYGVPDSGMSAQGHLLNPVFHGSPMLTGGSVGPEGSLLCFVLLGLVAVFIHVWLPQPRYPDPEAFGVHPRLATYAR